MTLNVYESLSIRLVKLNVGFRSCVELTSISIPISQTLNRYQEVKKSIQICIYLFDRILSFTKLPHVNTRIEKKTRIFEPAGTEIRTRWNFPLQLKFFSTSSSSMISSHFCTRFSQPLNNNDNIFKPIRIKAEKSTREKCVSWSKLVFPPLKRFPSSG